MRDDSLEPVSAGMWHIISRLRIKNGADGVRLSMADQASFAQALLSPPLEAPALKRAFARRSKRLHTE